MSTSDDRKHSNALLYGIIAGIVGGLLLGGLFPHAGEEVSFVGHMFLNALKMLVVPLVMASLIVGVSRLGDVRELGGIAGKTVSFYLITTCLAVAVGIAMVLIIQPGKLNSEADRLAFRGGENLGVPYTLQGDILVLTEGAFNRDYSPREGKKFMVKLSDESASRAIIQTVSEDRKQATLSPWTSASGQAVTPPPAGRGLQVDLAMASRVEGKSGSAKDALVQAIKGLVHPNLVDAMANTKILPLLIFSIIFGGVLTTMGENGKLIIRVFRGLDEAIMTIVHLLMKTAPVGIGCLVAGKLGEAGGFVKFLPQLQQIGLYALTVVLALGIHGGITLPLILRFVAKRPFLPFAKGMTPAALTAFSTASSSATLPITIDCVTTDCDVSERTAGFVLPLGATINMDGTALYEAVAAIFIANLYGIDLSMGMLFIIFMTSTLAAIGAAGIPEAGLVTMVIVLSASGLPIEGISMILIIDWALDRCRTTINVFGDSVGAAVIDRLEGPQAAETA